MTFFSELANPDIIESDCWRMLESSVNDRECGWRHLVLATVSDNTVRQRMVVLRDVDISARRILIHTDLRSGKIAAIRKRPDVSWLCYDGATQTQLQMCGTAMIHTDDEVADRLWQQQPESSLRGYLGQLPPGATCQVAEVNLPELFRDKIPDRNQLASGRRNFAAISCVISELEWLKLGRHGNLRARFQYHSTGAVSAEWLAP